VRTAHWKKGVRFIGLSVALAASLMGCATPHTTTSKGMTDYLAYSGKQEKWPRSNSALIKTDFAVPAYLGLPAKNYQIIGFVVPSKGWEGLPQLMWSDETRMANACNQAREHGADAIMVSNDPKIVQTFRTLAADSPNLLGESTSEIVAIKWTK
jgi:hypothetical protein